MSAKKESEELMNDILPLAKRILSEYGEFYPFGGYMKPDGEIVHVGAKDEETDHRKSKDLLYIFHQSFSTMAAAGECKATAIVFEVVVESQSTHKKSDAIQVSLEHADGYSVMSFSLTRSAKTDRSSMG